MRISKKILFWANLKKTELGYLYQFFLCYKYATPIMNAHIDIPGHLSGHLLPVIDSFQLTFQDF